MPAVRYLCARIGHGLLVLAGVSLLSFVLAGAAPGSFADELRIDPRVSPQTIAALQARYDLNGTVAAQYLRWLQSVSRGEFGLSVVYNGPVGPLLWPRVRNTLLLTVPATLLAWLLAVPIGAWAAARKGGWVDRLTAGVMTLLLGIPEVVFGLGLLLVAARTGYFPTGGMTSLDFDELGAWQKVYDIASHFFLPVTALALMNLPLLVRHVRASLVDVLRAPFIQAARATGVPEGRLLFRHALRTGANPLISLLGLSIAGLLSASLVIEAIMSWPGLGPLMLDAVLARDLHVVVAAVTCSTVLLVAGNLFADGLLYLADPRIRSGQR
jgi:peptide/nickel transport system permease protein